MITFWLAKKRGIKIVDTVNMDESIQSAESLKTAGVKRKGPTTSERKKVQFAAQLETVHTIPPLEDDTEEDEIGSEHATSSKVQRTSEMTILSSLHGKARRELREIDVLDLQSAVKYGIKSRGRNCPKTGLPRWKYVYGNIVYITDHTSTREVTSYKEAIEIQQATITPEIRERHRQDSLTLQQDPHLCATHSIVVIDQSGSMKKSDVKGFRNRSQAAYGVLALDYIAEQLHERGEDTGVLDAVSVIEMNDTGTIIYDREPLDWILFNNLLDRQANAKPRSHGNYCNALAEARNLISREVASAEDVELDDLPSYALIFLSDGKPSDKESHQIDLQISLLNEMVDTLQQNLSFHAIGLGQSTADFHALERLAAVVQRRGSMATFTLSSLNCAGLSAAFSTVATSVTATRLEKVAANDGQQVPRANKEVKLRGKHVPTSERKFVRNITGVSRWKYDHQKYEQKGTRDWPWTKVPMQNKFAAGFDIEKDPFGKGAERLAFMFHEIDHHLKRVGKAMVAKETLKIDDEERKIQFHEVFCRVQRQANEYAKKFNLAVAKAPQLCPMDSSLKNPGIRFLDCTVYEYKAIDGTVCGVLVEDYLKGKFTKYNSNNGYVKKMTGDERTIELQIGEVFMSDFLQAFSHWVYVQSDHKLLVCDLQGILQEEGRYPQFELTDPCICSKGKREQKVYGKTNTGARGLRAFKKIHSCNNVCKGLGLPAAFGMRKSQSSLYSA